MNFICMWKWHQFDLAWKGTFYWFKNKNSNVNKFKCAYCIEVKIFKCLCSKTINSYFKKYFHILSILL